MSRNDDITGDGTGEPGQNPPGQDPTGEHSTGNNDNADTADGYARGAGQDRGTQNWPRYQPTEHPEDGPGGFQPGTGYGVPRYPGSGGTTGPQGAGYPGAGASPYSGYSGSQGPGPYVGDPGGGAGLPTEQSSGRVDIMRAVRFGFRGVFANPLVWILGTFVLGLIYILLSSLAGALAYAIDPNGTMSGDALSIGNIFSNVVILAVTIIITIGVMRGSLITVDGKRAALRDFLHPVNVGQTVLLMIILSAVGMVIGVIFQNLALSAVVADPTSTMVEVNNSALVWFLLLLLVAMLLNPLYGYWIWYTADGRESAGSAIGVGFRDAARNYPKLLAYSVLGGIVMSVTIVVTFGLALVVLLPVSLLISAHLYRQMSGGVVPAEQLR